MKFDSFGKWSLVVLSMIFGVSLAARLAAQNQSPQDRTIYVGVIQDDRRELAKMGDSDLGPAKNRVVIAAFAKASAGWKKLDGLHDKVNWTVAFDGRNLGQILTEPDDTPQVITNPNIVESSITYAHSVNSILTHTDRIPTIGKPAGKFNGAFETVVRRPLIVVSEPNFRDPDQWKPATPPKGLSEPVFTTFRRAYPHVRQCDAQGEPMDRDWQVPESELGIVKAYGSSKGSFLIETHLKHRDCVFAVSGSLLTSLQGTQWFVASSNGTVRSLGADWELLDAGDYDNDGKSEVIFFFGDSETGDEGYILFYDNFQGKVMWAYP